MSFRNLGGLCAIALALCAYFASEPAHSAEPILAMATHGATTPPIGFVQFCRKNLADCIATASVAPRVALTRQRWDEIVSINRDVNRSIEPVSDQDQYGVEEFWTYPTKGKGDCEDYVLQKRKMLIARGWPAGSVLITVVQDSQAQGHAVLTVVTDRGDFVLDNQETLVLAWSQTDYRYIKRQSPYDVSRWESIEDRRTDYMASTR